MLISKIVDPHTSAMEWVKNLYNESFPDNEKSSLSFILSDQTDICKFLQFISDDVPVGFACILFDKDIAHIIYFAIDSSFQNQGFGSQSLQLVHQQFPDFRIIVDVESEILDAANYLQRVKRNQFYYRNGYHKTGISYRWQNEDYIILCANGDITETEFEQFWDDIVREVNTIAK